MDAGQWVRRGDEWHIIATVEGDDVVTRCKRRMAQVVKGVLLERLGTTPSADRCVKCSAWRDSRPHVDDVQAAGKSE